MLTIFSYDISSNTWSALPETQTILFGLCMFRGALLTVGGGCENGLTGRVSIYDEHSKVWKDHLFPPMPTERLSLSVFANDSALLACGGATWMVGSEYPEPTAIVEVYRDWCKSWCRMNDLPRPCAAMSSAFIDTMCYLLGSIDPEDKTGPMYTDIRDICSQQQQQQQHHNNNNHHNHHLHNLHVSSEKADQLKLDWLHLPSPPVTNTSIIATPSYLLAIGGCSQKRKVHVYFKDKRQWWTLASSDLPEDRESCGTVVLKSGEVMVVGGEDCYGVFTDSVYIGNLL